MSYLLDSNILLRMAQPMHPMHAEATYAVTTLLHQGESIHIIPQILYEFWSVATREVQYNGLGLQFQMHTPNLSGSKPSLFFYLILLPFIPNGSDW